MTTNERERADDTARQLMVAMRSSLDPNCWDIRQRLLYTDNEPAFWAEVCKTAMCFVQDPAQQILLSLEVINGLRRVDFTDDDLFDRLDAIRASIASLGIGHPDARKLLSMLLYHSAAVCHATGKFAGAALYHLEAAVLADNSRDQCLAAFNQRLEEMYNYARPGQSQEAIEGVLAAAKDLLPHLGEEPQDAQWRASVYGYQSFCEFLLLSSLSLNLCDTNTMDERKAYLQNFFQHGNPAFRPIWSVVEAIQWYTSGREGAIACAANEQIEENVEWYGFAQLVLLATHLRRREESHVAEIQKRIAAWADCHRHYTHFVQRWASLLDNK
ncbi:MAG: hypothetical protein WCX71_00425 [Candidatus Buchananbacteria bacterium]